MSQFAGLSDQSFDAYAREKWRSNVYNRERLTTKELVLALGAQLAPRLITLEGTQLRMEASIEHPALHNHKQVEAQHLFFSRDEAARKELDRYLEKSISLAARIDDPTPQRTHLFLFISLRHEGLSFGLRIHPDARVDRQNFTKIVGDLYAREQLCELVSNLPRTFRIGMAPDGLLPVAEVTSDRLSDLVAAFERAKPLLMASGPWFSIESTIDRNDAIALGPALAATLSDEFERILPLYWSIAWSRDNDRAEFRQTLQREAKEVRTRGLAKGDRVRVLSGLLRGQTGTVQDIDAKGGAKITVGKVAVKLNAEALEQI